MRERGDGGGRELTSKIHLRLHVYTGRRTVLWKRCYWQRVKFVGLCENFTYNTNNYFREIYRNAKNFNENPAYMALVRFSFSFFGITEIYHLIHLAWMETERNLF